jgi:OTU domain-containing protein 6
MDELQSKHRKEQKDLQGRITQKKKNASKKTRKGVIDECERLQKELEDRQQAEAETLSSRLENDHVSSLPIEEESKQEVVESPQLNGATNGKPADLNLSNELSLTTQQPSKKPSRQKARLARRAAEQEAQAAQAAEEAAKLPDLRTQEITNMRHHFDKLGFTELSIRPDGHCMFSAVALLISDASSHQLKSKTDGLNASYPYKAVRAKAARFISEHPADFEPFLEEPIDQYTNKIQNTAEWGGQLELQAIARSYGIDINVLQADGRIEKIESGSDSETEPIWLTYYRHSFGLGEHYNALKKRN